MSNSEIKAGARIRFTLTGIHGTVLQVRTEQTPQGPKRLLWVLLDTGDQVRYFADSGFIEELAEDAYHDGFITIRPGDLVEADVVSSRPRTVQIRVDRAPWRSSAPGKVVLTAGRGGTVVYASSLRVIEE